jgi:hypothetical protein
MRIVHERRYYRFRIKFPIFRLELIATQKVENFALPWQSFFMQNYSDHDRATEGLA